MESIKSVCQLAIIVALSATGIAWISDPPDRTVWALRIGSPIAAVVSFGGIVAIARRADKVPDFLSQSFGTFFQSNGFCFALAGRLADSVFYIDVYFQNQYDRPCEITLALRPVVGAFARNKMNIIRCEIDCGGAAYGVACIPMAVPANVQGKTQHFNIGATVRYPQGKGQRLRYREGMLLRTNARFRSKFTSVMGALAVLGGGILLSRTARVTLAMPVGVSQALPEGVEFKVTTLWLPHESHMDPSSTIELFA